MVAVTAEAVAADLRVDTRATLLGMLVLLSRGVMHQRSILSSSPAIVIERTSRTTTPAPSPMTKPSRCESNGRDASCGRSLNCRQ